jgi:hypothetical protein
MWAIMRAIAEPDAGAAVLGVVAAVPGGVLHDGLAADLVERDRLRALVRRRGHDDLAPRELRVLDREEHGRHPAHRAAQDGVELGDAEVSRSSFWAFTMSRIVTNGNERP